MAKVFHCADIHLDSPFSLFSPKKAEGRRTELRSAFTSAMLMAKDYGADIFIISGDLFDGEYVTRDTRELLEREFAKFPSCNFFISPGNHDPWSLNSPYRTMTLPDNVHVFSPTRSRISLDSLGVDVYGFGYSSRSYESSPVRGWQIEDPNKTNILVCHGDMTSAVSSVGPISKEDIAGSGFDYIALGHIHKASGLQSENGVYYCYPGCIEGRSFDEQGYKGAMMGLIEKGRIDMRPVRLSKGRYEAVEVDISGSSEKLVALDIIRKAIKPYTDDTTLRLTLAGELKSAFVISDNEIGTGREFPCHIELIDNTSLAPDFGELEQSNTLKGVFFRTVKEKMAETIPGSEEYAILEDALKYGLCALDDRSIAGFSGGDMI